MNEPKKFLGNAKEITFQDGGTMLKVSFNREDCQYMVDNVNAKGYINLKVSTRREPTDYATHSIAVDTWKPQQQGASQQAAEPFPVGNQDAFVIPSENEMF